MNFVRHIFPALETIDTIYRRDDPKIDKNDTSTSPYTQQNYRSGRQQKRIKDKT